MKSCLARILAFTLSVLSLAGCGSPEGRGAEKAAAVDGAEKPEVAITFSNMLPPDHPQSVAVTEVLSKEIAEKTGGKFTVDPQLNGALGSDSETVEATIMGNMYMTGPTCASLANIDPSWYILDIPYVFLSSQQARDALDGELGQFLSESLEKTAGLICLGFGESGMRNISNNEHEIKVPADLSGLKIRVLENKYHLATFSVLGANPTAMAFSEVYTALQTRQIDGQDNPITITATSRFYEVQKYYSRIEHLFCGNCIVVNAEWFHSLPEDYQSALREAVQNTIRRQRELIDKNEADYLSRMEGAGVIVTELTEEEKQAFVDATQPVRDRFVAEYGDVGRQMLGLAEKYAE